MRLMRLLEFLLVAIEREQQKMLLLKIIRYLE